MIKKYSDMVNEKFELMDFDSALNKYIINQTVQSSYDVPAYGDYNIPSEERYYGSGLAFNNGYKYISYGGGCSGEDCNSSFIIDPDNKLVAVSKW